MNDGNYYEVVRETYWYNVLTGHRASIYGAVPWTTDNAKLAWVIKEGGWTVRNPLTGQVGIGRPACATFAEANNLALKLGRPSSIGIGD